MIDLPIFFISKKYIFRIGLDSLSHLYELMNIVIFLDIIKIKTGRVALRMKDERKTWMIYLWEKRMLYMGPLLKQLSLSQGAATLLVSLGDPVFFKIKGENEQIECSSLLLPAGLSVTIYAGNTIVANCNLDPLGADFSGLSSLMLKTKGDMLYELKPYVEFKNVYKDMFEKKLNSKDAYNLLEDLLERKFKYAYPNHIVDKRVEKVVEKIKKTADKNISVEDLACSVNLSVPRLVQLFKKQTGIPIRRYRLWHRLFVTVLRINQGDSLTEAAINSGFTDSAHFSRTFKSMFGISPSTILLQPDLIDIIIQK